MYIGRNILLAILVSLTLWGCKNEVKSVVANPIDTLAVPNVLTTDITSLVSDSGITKYRIVAKRWDIYDEGDTPKWTFPNGLYLEQFDTTLAVEATFQCDSAIFLKNDKLWRFMSNVRSWNTKKEIILTNELYWDQNRKKVYSDSFIHIEQPERILEGYGFESNERLTTYRLKRPMGIFPVDDAKRGGSARRDSINCVNEDESNLAEETEEPKLHQFK